MAHFISKLRNLLTGDPKSYWSLLNKSSGQPSSTIEKVALETFYEHFENINNLQNRADDNFQLSVNFTNHTFNKNDEFNRTFSEEEVLRAVKSLKNNKSCRNDLILNKFLKCPEGIKDAEMFLYNLFNTVFDTGIIQESWLEGIICPIYKNTGDAGNPDNYRGITILSCFGKLFTAVLNNRLNIYLESMDVYVKNKKVSERV